MTTTQAPPPDVQVAVAAPGDGRRTITEPEPLATAPGDQAANLVDLIHRAVERHADREAMRWKPPRSRRAEGEAGAAPADGDAWVSRTYREMWDWV
ncbi:MAG: hypothetical protein ACRDGJ_02250, partial [Candidatus Limnocylindria bacterium]